ncbi:Serine/threonine-protein kinase DCLK2 [Lamellibrachia satsuma]|nr:Serine/threonine-protein kinase DCLK2 [Lamellibrachia satsuma]
MTRRRHWPRDKEILGVNHRPTAYRHWPRDKEILGVNHRPTAYRHWPRDKEILGVNHRPTAYRHWPHDKEVLGVNHRPAAYRHWPHDQEVLGVNHRPATYRHWPHDKEALGVNHRPAAYRHWPHDKEATGYGLKVDIWAVGVITYILLCGFPPFASETNNQEELFEKISSGKYEFTSPFWDGISDSAKELISYMLQKDAEDRYTASELLQHAWLSDDTAKDEDLHDGVASRIEENFVKATADRQPAMNLIACTALDHGSRYFQGKRPPLQPLHTQPAGHEDEVF